MQMHEQIIVDGQEQPISRTYQYRKVMKPMLERKRRARINRCLDELKDLMVSALAGDGENVAKLEKADILELTVRHLHKLQRQQRLSANPVIDADRFRAGYTHCANEVSRCLAATPGVDIALGTKLMTHLGHKLNAMDKTGPLTIHVSAPQTSPATISDTCSTTDDSSSSGEDYPMPLTPASSQPSPVRITATERQEVEGSSYNSHRGLLQVAKPVEPVWRPW
ncbi:enhancer of split m7 protein-like [Athalia rosae]|uniref:enhancer of split m7 protein-like n=1 Tax=Athalia rosae TaxID=37344 RepID=UPI00203338C9|nr:enhancer of split m7 protein-like [Athalia rosae]